MAHYIYTSDLHYYGKVIKGELRELTEAEEALLKFVEEASEYASEFVGVMHSGTIYNEDFSEWKNPGLTSKHVYLDGRAEILDSSEAHWFRCWEKSPIELKEAYEKATWLGEIRNNVYNLYKTIC